MEQLHHRPGSRSPRERKMSKRETESTSATRGRGAAASGTAPIPDTRRNGKKKDGKKDAEKRENGTDRCTVVDVDEVREKDDRENEESLALLEIGEQEGAEKARSLGVCESLLTVLVVVLVLLFLPLTIWFCFKVVSEHERAVIFRMGHLLKSGSRGPGIVFYLPLLDVCHKVDIRLKMLKVPSHTVVMKDLVRPEVAVACFYRIENVTLCSTALCSISSALQALVQGAVRDVSANHDFSHFLLDRKQIGQEILVATDSVAGRWGIRVERTDIEEVSLPAEVQNSLAVEAEARRQAQVKVIAAEGEKAVYQALQSSLSSPVSSTSRLLQWPQHLSSDRPALILTLPSDFLTVTPDLLPPPPPPPPPPTVKEAEEATDSPMM